MLWMRVKDYRGSPWFGDDAAMTQMHQYLDRRPWEENVGDLTCVERDKYRADQKDMCPEVKETMSQGANVVPEAQRCTIKPWSSQIDSGNCTQSRFLSRNSLYENGPRRINIR